MTLIIYGVLGIIIVGCVVAVASWWGALAVAVMY